MGSPPSISEAEILPPVEVEAKPSAVRKQRPSWAVAPATYVLMGINCAVFIAMAANTISILSPTPDQLINWGANSAGQVLVNGEWLRIVSAMFIHVGIIHLATNMWCLWNLGLLAEPLVGSWGLFAVYILTGAAGNLLSTFRNWYNCSDLWAKTHDINVYPAGAGASGAVFGIAGVLIILLNSTLLPVPREELKKLRRSVIYFAAINLAIGFSISFGANHFQTGLNIDNSAHLGGFVCGLIFALPMIPRFGSPRPEFLFRLRAAVPFSIFFFPSFLFI